MVLLLALGAASAQQTEPTPTPSTSQATGAQSASPAAPAASPTPELQQQEPQLLPESNAIPFPPPETSLPPLPQDLIPQGAKPQFPGSIPTPTSAEQQEKDRIRFRQIRTIAVRNPYAIYFLRRATLASTDEMKREYLIDTFENANNGRAAQLVLRPTVPARDIPRCKASIKGE
jgi:hypothetical protein